MTNEKKKQIQIKFDYGMLFLGKSIDLQGYHIRHPKVKDIYSMKNTLNYEEEYWSMIGSLLSDPYDNMVMLDDMGIDYEEVTAFDVFIINWKKNEELYQSKKEEFDKFKLHPLDITKKSLTFFLGEHDWNIVELFDGTHILYDKKNPKEYMINEDVFQIFLEFIKAIHRLDYKDRVNPANQQYKRLLIEEMREEQEIKKFNKIFQMQKEKEKINVLGNMISAVCVGGNGGIDVFNVENLSIFQLYTYYLMTMKKDNVSALKIGMYSGMISSENIKDDNLKWTDDK